jgi:hypothetical protein
MTKNLIFRIKFDAKIMEACAKEFNMTVHTKWEILVQILLKSVELFKSYGLFGEPKVVDFLFFGKM